MPSPDPDRGLLIERLHEEARIGETLRSLGQMLAAGLDAQRVLQAVTDAATRLSGAQFGAFFHATPGQDGAELLLHTLSAEPGDAFAGLPTPRHTLIFGPTLRGEGVLRLDDVTLDPRFAQNPPYDGLPPGHPPVRSYLAVPVTAAAGHVLGGLFFGHADAGVFDERAERYVVALAQHAVLALSNAELYAAEQRARLVAEESARRLALLQLLALRVGEVRGVRAVADTVVTGASRGLLADGALVGVLVEDGSAIELVAASGVDGTMLERWRRFPLAPGLPATDALRTGRPVLLRSLDERNRLYPNLVGEEVTQRSWAILPLALEGRAVGMLSFSWATEHPLDDASVAVMMAVAQHCAQALDRARLDEAEQAARERLAVLADVSRVLSGGLHPERVLGRLVPLLVPRLADGVSAYLLDEGGLRLVAIEHDDPAQRSVLGELAGRATGGPSEVVLDRVLEGGQTVYAAEVTPAQLVERARGAEEAALLKARDVRSAVVVPLAARGRSLGLLCLTMGGSDRRFSSADVELIEDLARRAGLALDMARRYAHERETAVTLQRALLPAGIPELECATGAARYSPGADDATAGGDWYEVIPLSAGRVGLVIGDVMGRGIGAAAVMGQLRSAVRAYALLDLPPAELLTHLDSLVTEIGQSRDENQIVTCIYAAFEPGTGRLCFASAGHPPPLLLEPGSPPRRLHPPGGVPLGVGGVEFVQDEVEVTPGSTLVLFTDGLVESRERDVDSGIDELAEALRGPVGDLDELCDRALRVAGDPAGHLDDVALLVVSFQPTPAELVSTRTLPVEATAAGLARGHVAAQVARWEIPAPYAERCSLLTSELVTNSIRHARGSIQLLVRRSATSVFVEVADGDTRLPRLRYSDAEDEGGRGLYLVDRLATRWGMRPVQAGKVVWFEVALS